MTRTERLRREDTATVKRAARRQGFDNPTKKTPADLIFDEHRCEAPPPAPPPPPQSQIERTVEHLARKNKSAIMAGDYSNFTVEIADLQLKISDHLVQNVVRMVLAQ